MLHHPIKAIPPPEPVDSIAPHQVWVHLDANQQKQLCQTLVTIIKQLLTTMNIVPTFEEISDDNKSN